MDVVRDGKFSCNQLGQSHRKVRTTTLQVAHRSLTGDPLSNQTLVICETNACCVWETSNQWTEARSGEWSTEMRVLMEGDQNGATYWIFSWCVDGGP